MTAPMIARKMNPRLRPARGTTASIAAAINMRLMLGIMNAIAALSTNLLKKAPKRDARRLKEVGRRQYALELVWRLNKRFAAQADEAQYRYGPEASNRDYIRRVQLRVAPKRGYAEITRTRDNMIANLGNDFDRAREKEAA